MTLIRPWFAFTSAAALFALGLACADNTSKSSDAGRDTGGGQGGTGGGGGGAGGGGAGGGGGSGGSDAGMGGSDGGSDKGGDVPMDMGGTGGGGGTGGADGGGAEFGTSADLGGAEVSTSCDFPKCVGDLVAACTPMGACTNELGSTDVGAYSNFCYGNGVKILTVTATEGSGTRATTTVKKSDDSVCYVFEVLNDGTNVSWYWKDAMDATVAKGTTTVGDPVSRLYCVDDGGKVEHTIGAKCPLVPAGPADADGGMCTIGACK